MPPERCAGMSEADEWLPSGPLHGRLAAARRVVHARLLDGHDLRPSRALAAAKAASAATLVADRHHAGEHVLQVDDMTDKVVAACGRVGVRCVGGFSVCISSICALLTKLGFMITLRSLQGHIHCVIAFRDVPHHHRAS